MFEMGLHSSQLVRIRAICPVADTQSDKKKLIRGCSEIPPVFNQNEVCEKGVSAIPSMVIRWCWIMETAFDGPRHICRNHEVHLLIGEMFQADPENKSEYKPPSSSLQRFTSFLRSFQLKTIYTQLWTQVRYCPYCLVGEASSLIF